jgi:hypothetical protein
VHLVAQNVSPSQPIVSGAPIELAFDRLLLPYSVTRQTFVLRDLLGNFLSPAVLYDPVSRVVRICPMAPLAPDQSYHIDIVSPQSPTDANGVRAIDGATLDPSTTTSIDFPVVSGPAYVGFDACPAGAPLDAGAGGDAGNAGAPMRVTEPNVDFCKQVMPIFNGKCGGSSCHGGSAPAAGLWLTDPQGVAATAVGRPAQGANTGPAAKSEPPGRLFGVDMPIVNPNDPSTATGSPADSWLIYKLLLAVPPACSSTPGAAPCDASAPAVHQPFVSAAWQPLSDSERTTLGTFVQGREMPFPTDPSAAPGSAAEPLTLDEMETVSWWIVEGAPVKTCD